MTTRQFDFNNGSSFHPRPINPIQGSLSVRHWLSSRLIRFFSLSFPFAVDFLQFMLVAAQWRVFKLEQRSDWESYGGGSNTPVLTDTLPGPNDRDFISTKE